jgi:hypothetical protein
MKFWLFSRTAEGLEVTQNRHEKRAGAAASAHFKTF